MVSSKSVEKQLKRIGFKRHGWGKGELDELHNILLPDEEIYECVNGIYEGGFALLIATDIRVLLIDKKPLNYLTVEDLRFDMINEIDYNHRLLVAYIAISTGSRNLKFRSYNQPRLRKLITHVQHCMAASKKKQSSHQEDQNLHLEKINQQLQTYLRAQHQYQREVQQAQLARQAGAAQVALPEPVKPSPELSDYLFAQSLLAQHEAGQKGESAPIYNPEQLLAAAPAEPAGPTPSLPDQSGAATATTPAEPVETTSDNRQLQEMYDDGLREVFGKHQAQSAMSQMSQVAQASEGAAATPAATASASDNSSGGRFKLEITPLRLAYAKLPTVLTNRKFGIPSRYPRIKIRPDAPVARETDMAAAR